VALDLFRGRLLHRVQDTLIACLVQTLHPYALRLPGSVSKTIRMIWWEYRGVGVHQLGEKTQALCSGVGEFLEGGYRAFGKHLHLPLPFLIFAFKLLCGHLDTWLSLRLLYMLHLELFE
jgi:hypothetical protein